MNQWIKDNQTWLLLAWPVLSAAFSLLYTQLESMPRWHAVFSTLAGFGIDIPTIWNAIGRLFTGNPPGASGGGRGSIQELPGPQFKAPTAKPPGPPTAARKETLLYRWKLAACALFLVACQALAPAANLSQCMLADVAKGDSIAQIALDCGADIPSVIIALLESADPKILNSKAHAEAVATKAAVLQATAQMASHK